MAEKIIPLDSRFKEIWDLIIVSGSILIAIELPLRLAFDYGLTNIYIDIIISILFFADIFINFRTQIYSKGVLLKNKKQIQKRYIRTYFSIDLLAAIPFFLISLLLPGIHILRWLSLTRLLKTIRIHSLYVKWRNRQAINPGILRLGVFFLWIFLFAHWIACAWIFIAQIEQLRPIPSYIDAIYWCITTITTVGYGDISPVTDLQKILTMGAMILGVGLYGYIIGNIASLLSNLDITKARFLKQMEDINAFLLYKAVPKKLKQRVHHYYQYVWDNRLAQSEHQILATLPPSLKKDISLHIHRRLIEQVPFFKKTSKVFISDMISQLQPMVFLPGDFIFKKGDVGSCMYFVSNGALDVLSHDESSSIAKLKGGDFFGEIALIKKIRRTRSVQATDHSNLYALEKTHFDMLLEKYPVFKKHIYNTIKKREQQPSTKKIVT